MEFNAKRYKSLRKSAFSPGPDEYQKDTTMKYSGVNYSNDVNNNDDDAISFGSSGARFRKPIINMPSGPSSDEYELLRWPANAKNGKYALPASRRVSELRARPSADL